jgi:nicotinamide-nucleotide amidase
MTHAAAEILDLARLAGLRIATAESCTGGLVAAALTAIPGSSDVVDRGFITYSNAAKHQMLGVMNGTLDDVGAVSEDVAGEMAEGALDRSDAQLAIAITGIAGPGGSDFKPEGRVCFALAREGRATRVETVEFGAIGREAVRQAAVEHALSMILWSLT